MTTTQLTNAKPGNALPTQTSSDGTTKNPFALDPEAFIKLMVTQLKSQDPLKPADNGELLSQMSNIGQLQSSTSLQSTLKSVTLQTQVGSASALIGKRVTGINGANNSVSGVVQSVAVSGSDVTLNLDNGDAVKINNVSSIAAEHPSAAASAEPTVG